MRAEQLLRQATYYTDYVTLANVRFSDDYLRFTPETGHQITDVCFSSNYIRYWG